MKKDPSSVFSSCLWAGGETTDSEAGWEPEPTQWQRGGPRSSAGGQRDTKPLRPMLRAGHAISHKRKLKGPQGKGQVRATDLTGSREDTRQGWASNTQPTTRTCPARSRLSPGTPLWLEKVQQEGSGKLGSRPPCPPLASAGVSTGGGAAEGGGEARKVLEDPAGWF